MTSINEQSQIIHVHTRNIREQLQKNPLPTRPSSRIMYEDFAKSAVECALAADIKASEAVFMSGTYVKPKSAANNPGGLPSYGTADDKLGEAVDDFGKMLWNYLRAKSWLPDSCAAPSQITAVAGKFADLWLGEVFGMLDDMQVMELSAYRAMFQNEFIAAEVAKNGPGVIMAQSRRPEEEEEDEVIENRHFWSFHLNVLADVAESPDLTDQQKESLSELMYYVRSLELGD